MNPIHVALVGFGHIAQKHMRALSHMPDAFKLVAICEPELQRPVDPSIAVYPALEAALSAHPELELIILTTPSGLHPAQTIMAAQAGCHVLTEKPMALTSQDALQMMEACDNAQVSLFVTQQMRLLPLMRHLKQALNNNQLGTITNCAMNLFWTRPQRYYDEASWRGTTEMDGGTLLNQANHFLDLLIWFFGVPDAVFSQALALGRQIETDDTCVLYAQWPHMLATMHISMLTYPKNLESSITVLGQKGTIKLGGVSCTDLLNWQFEGFSASDQDALSLAQETHQPAQGHTLVYEQVRDALRHNIPYTIPTHDVLDVLRVVEAAQRSHQTGTLTSLASKTRSS